MTSKGIDILLKLSSDNFSFGSLLREYRTKAKKTQRQLINLLDNENYPLSNTMLCYYERSQRLPKDPSIIAPFVRCITNDKEEQIIVRDALLTAWIFDHLNDVLRMVEEFQEMDSKGK